MSSLRPSRYVSSTNNDPTTATATTTNGSGSFVSGKNGHQTPTDDRSALAYLLRYETMVRSQDVEDDATTHHLRPLFDRLIELGGGGARGSRGSSQKTGADDVPDLIASGSASSDNDEGDCNPAAGAAAGGAGIGTSDSAVLTYRAMRVALTMLDAMASSSAGHDNKASRAIRGGEKDGDGGGQAQLPLLTTDRQLMLLLRTIVGMSTELVAGGGDADDQDGDGDGDGGGLTYAEFLQAYKVVVGGMQTLQRMPRRRRRMAAMVVMTRTTSTPATPTTTRTPPPAAATVTMLASRFENGLWV